jgi:signal transduction histidine kinase
MEGIPLRVEPTDLRLLLSGALEALRGQADRFEIGLTIEAPDELPKVAVDAEKIAWAVATLVGNALRFVRHGTRRMPGGSVVVHLAREPDAVVVTVEDDGPGIPPDTIPWLFRRRPGATHAAGLALMLIHDVVAAHGGTVKVTSATEGAARGTRVTLRLPLGAPRDGALARSST